MAKKKPSIVMEDIFKEKDRELTDELFDITTSKGLVNIPIGKISANPNQPRKTFHEESITELAESIKEHGVISPIIVRPLGEKYEIIAGERRFKAALINKLKEIPAIIRKVTDNDAKIISLIENIQREDLNDIDRSAALRELKNNLNISWVEVGKRLGLSRNRVLELVSLLDLPDEIKEDIRQKKLTAKHGRALRLLLNQSEVLRDSYNFIKAKNLTSNKSLELVKAIKSTPGRTIEESYNTIKVEPVKVTSPKKDPVKTIVLEADKLIKTLDEIKPESLNEESKKKLHSKLLKVYSKIGKILKSVQD